jgi:hypothetical protein
VTDSGDGAAPDDFSVDTFTHVLSGVAERCPGLMKRLGAFETRLLADRLPPLRQPVYVAGLARSGSTVLLEILSTLPGVATHRYRDFPLLHVPFLWNRFLGYATPDSAGPARERAHRDGILVTRESPEAFEEVLWMSFFPHLHDSSHSQVLDAATHHAAFEWFYRDHVRKILLLRGGNRYVSKGNYNVTRLEYLLNMFPDARFVIPVRDPQWQVASLMKQQQLFLRGQRAYPRARAHLRRAGHFEFGADRRVIHTGDDAQVRRILACWREGREVEGWARCWSLVYGHVADRLTANPALAAASLVLSHESLCCDPGETARTLFRHCGFEGSAAALAAARARVRSPSYNRPDLNARERDLVDDLTGAVVARLRPLAAGVEGYGYCIKN